MPLDFAPVRLEDQDRFLELFSRTPEPVSDCTFVNLWGWREAYGLTWAEAGGLAWIRQEIPFPAFWAPVGDRRGRDWPALVASVAGQGARFVRVPEALALEWGGIPGVAVSESRDQWDYVYRVADLVTLSGRLFHKKKNLWNQFVRSYRFEYRPFTPELAAGALALQEQWCRWKDCEGDRVLEEENRCIHRVLSSWAKLSGLSGGVLFVEGRTAAWAVGQALSPDMFLVHFEKGDPAFKGAYQAVNREFLAHAAAGYAEVNREQDLGDPGLRKAKLSYHPARFLKKYEIAWGGS